MYAPAARQREHLAEDCRDENCPRYPCRIYRKGLLAGFELGYAPGVEAGYAQGYPDGYAAGYDAGLAACAATHKK